MSPDGDPGEGDGEEDEGQVLGDVGGEEAESPEATPIPVPEIPERKPKPVSRLGRASNGVREMDTTGGKEEGGGRGGRVRDRGRTREGKSTTEGGRNRTAVSKMSNHIPPSGIPSASSNATVNVSPMGVVTIATMTTPTSSPRKGRKEEGWKEVGRR